MVVGDSYAFRLRHHIDAALPVASEGIRGGYIGEEHFRRSASRATFRHRSRVVFMAATTRSAWRQRAVSCRQHRLDDVLQGAPAGRRRVHAVPAQEVRRRREREHLCWRAPEVVGQ